MADMDASAAGRFLQARRRRVVVVCAYCGKRFEGTVRRRYCSQTCANKDYYRLHRDRLRAKRRVDYWHKKAQQQGEA